MEVMQITFDADICNMALKLLRQDVEISTTDTSPVADKCRKLYDLAYMALASAQEWSTPLDGTTPTNPTLLRPLVYAVARELAIPITGRISDLDAMTSAYKIAVEEAKIKDLEDAAANETDNDLLESVALIRQYIVPDGRIPWGWASMKAKYELIKDGARRYVLDFYGWSFCRREIRVLSTPRGAGMYVTSMPPDADRILECKGHDGVLASTTMANGEIITSEPIFKIAYQATHDDFDGWPLMLRKAYIATIASMFAISMPAADINNKTSALVQYRDSILSQLRMNETRQSRATYTSAVRNNRYARAMRGEDTLLRRLPHD